MLILTYICTLYFFNILILKLLKEDYHKWYSPTLSKDIEMLVFGHAGYPVVLFPTTMGRFYECKDFKLIESARWFLEQGLIQIYCPDYFPEKDICFEAV